MLTTESRLVFVALVLLTIPAGSVGLGAVEQTSSSPVAANTKWMGVWALTLDGARGPEAHALLVYVAPEWDAERGKVVAKINSGRGVEIKITDVSIRGNVLVLKYKQQGQRGEVDVVSTLSMRPDGRLTLSNQQGQGNQIGSGKLAAPAALLDELLRESDVSLKIKKARAAGLIAERTDYGGGNSSFVVKEPTTGMVLLTGLIAVD